MASRKVADAHVLFSAEGIPALSSAVKSLGGDLSQLSATTGRGGLFGNNFAKDIAQLNQVERSLKRNLQLKNQLAAAEVRASLEADRTLASRSAQSNARNQIASRGFTAATMVSPTLQRTQQDSAALDFQQIVKQRADLKRFIGTSSTSGTFKSKSSAVGNQIFDQNPTALRKSADEIRNTLKSISRFGPAGSKTKNAVDEVKRRMLSMAESAEALATRMEKLDRIIEQGRKLSPGKAGKIRGNVRDLERAGERAEAIQQRKAAREDLSVPPRGILRRRFDEINKTEGLTDRQESQEIGIAANEVAASLRTLAQDVRETQIDEALRDAARKMGSGQISSESFRSEVAKAEAKRGGTESAGSIIEDVSFRAGTNGESKETVSRKQETQTLRERKKEIDKLISSSRNLTAEEKKRLEVESQMINKEVKSSESRAAISGEMDSIEGKVKDLVATERDYQERVEKGEKLTKQDTKARKDNKRQLEQQVETHEKLGRKMAGHNNDLKSAAGMSRRYNFMIQQASYGVQDFVQVIGQTGLSGALRASANNMAAVAGATGSVGGALTGALGTIAMIGFAQALESMGGEAETAAEKIEKLNKKLEDNHRLRVKSNELTGAITLQDILSGGAGVSPFRSASREADELRIEREGLSRRALVQGTRLLGGGNTLTGEESARRALANDPNNKELQEIVEGIDLNDRQIQAANSRAKRSLRNYQRNLIEYVNETNRRIEDGENIAGSAFSQLRTDATSLMSDINASRVRLLDAPNEDSADQAREILTRQEAALDSTRSAIEKLSDSDSQATSIGSVESLHRKIQESLFADSEKSLSEKRNELLEEIAGHSQEQVTRDKKPREEQIKPKPTPEEKLRGFYGLGGGMMSVPSPRFSYDVPTQEQSAERVREARRKRAISTAEGGPGAPSLPEGPEPFNRRRAMSAIKGDPDLVNAKELLRETQSTYIDITGRKAERGQDANSKLRIENQRAISRRNIEAMSGRNAFSGKSTEEAMSSARESVRQQGYSDLLGMDKPGEEAFFGARRGGTVSDSATQRRGVFDDASTFGRRRFGGGLTPSQQQAISSPVSAPIPGESPDENRRRRVAERNKQFEARPEAGVEINARTVKGAIAAMGPASHEPRIPVATPEGAARFRAERKAKAGPEINRDNVKAAIAAMPPASHEPEGPAFVNTHEAKSGPRSLMRKQASAEKGAAARSAREKELKAARDKRLSLESGREAIKAEAEADLESRRRFDPKTGENLPTQKSAARRRKIRADQGKAPSWLENYEASQSSTTPLAAAPIASDGLSSNVDTEATKQIAAATDEAIQYHKNTSDKMNQLVELLKTRADSGGLVIV